MKSLKSIDIKVLEDAAFFAFMLYTPIIAFQNLLSPYPSELEHHMSEAMNKGLEGLGLDIRALACKRLYVVF